MRHVCTTVASTITIYSHTLVHISLTSPSLLNLAIKTSLTLSTTRFPLLLFRFLRILLFLDLALNEMLESVYCSILLRYDYERDRGSCKSLYKYSHLRLLLLFLLDGRQWTTPPRVTFKE